MSEAVRATHPTSVIHVKVTVEERNSTGNLIPTHNSEFHGDLIVGAAMLRALADKFDRPKPNYRVRNADVTINDVSPTNS